MANANLPKPPLDVPPVTDPQTGDPTESAALNDRPPILGSWRNIYGVVLFVLAIEVFLFALLGKVFS